jgi:uncharacterized protein (TIGR03546 family)
MTVLLKQIFGLLKLLNSDTGSNQIAAGIAFGLILGFSPLLSLQALIILICLLIFRVQIGAAFISAFFFAFVAYLFDPICNAIGIAVLESESLKPIFTQLYNMPIIPFTRFYNSLVMGSGVLAVILTPFVFFSAKIAIHKYRVTIVARFQHSKFWKIVKATSFYQWYAKYDQLFG